MENVDHDIGVIGDDPLTGREAVDGHRFHVVVLFQAVVQFAGDGFQVWLRCAGADDEEIRKAGNATEINGDDILRLFFRSIVRAETGELFRVDGVGPGRGDGR